MAEYIEREDLLELYRMDDPVLNENGHVPLSVIRQNIMDIPSADVAPVVHGRWLKQDNYNCCSVCKQSVARYCVRWYKYCPNCGAKMDEGETNETN